MLWIKNEHDQFLPARSQTYGPNRRPAVRSTALDQPPSLHRYQHGSAQCCSRAPRRSWSRGDPRPKPNTHLAQHEQGKQVNRMGYSIPWFDARLMMATVERKLGGKLNSDEEFRDRCGSFSPLAPRILLPHTNEVSHPSLSAGAVPGRDRHRHTVIPSSSPLSGSGTISRARVCASGIRASYLCIEEMAAERIGGLLGRRRNAPSLNRLHSRSGTCWRKSKSKRRLKSESPMTEGAYKMGEGLGALHRSGEQRRPPRLPKAGAWNAKTTCRYPHIIIMGGPCVTAPCRRVPLVSHCVRRFHSVSVHVCT